MVIVPGIMGSELYDDRAKQALWGVGPIVLNAGRLRARSRLRALQVTDDEREGVVGRVVAPRLLSVPDWLPGLGGFEPYGNLVTSVTSVVLHRDAVLCFPYDWRLDVDHNARLLARAAATHLHRWRQHPAVSRSREQREGDRAPRLVFVAHSMGGLLVRAMRASEQQSEPLDIRAVITLGTPFQGAAKTLQLLNTGRGVPLRPPAESTRAAARTMPGLYDLLPWYRCVITEDDVVHLRPRDVTVIGGDEALAEAAFRRRAATKDALLTAHTGLAGTGQVTTQSVELKGGEVLGHPFGFRRDRDGKLLRANGRPITEDHGGDGTVFRHSARSARTPSIGIAQRHEALARAAVPREVVLHTLTEVEDLGAVLSTGREDLGLDLPDEATVGEPLEIEIRGDVDPSGVTCAIEDAWRRDAIVTRPVVKGRADQGVVTIRTVLDRPGLMRVRIASGTSQVTKLVMSAPESELRD